MSAGFDEGSMGGELCWEDSSSGPSFLLPKPFCPILFSNKASTVTTSTSCRTTNLSSAIRLASCRCNSSTTSSIAFLSSDKTRQGARYWRCCGRYIGLGRAELGCQDRQSKLSPLVLCSPTQFPTLALQPPAQALKCPPLPFQRV